MSFPLDCACPTPTITPPVQVPGVNGLNAYSIVTAGFVIPALNGQVAINVDTTLWMVTGQIVIIGQGQTALVNPGPGTFQVASINSATQFNGKWLGGASDAAAGASIDSSAVVAPAGAILFQKGTTGVMAGTPGTVTVTGVKLTSTSTILVSRNTSGGTLGNLKVAAADRNVGAGTFIIRSDANETSTIDWLVIG